MIAAIYARKSTKQDEDLAEEAKSVPRQVAGARTFIASKGWTLDERHIYTDLGVSGALFADRPEFQHMMRDAEAGSFEAVVFYDLDRFGRHAHHTMVALHALADLNVTVWDFSTGVRVDIDSFEGGMMTTIKALVAQQQREQCRKHTRDALRRKAEAGFVAGGRVFGYDNVRIAPGQSDRRINPAEAVVVIDIYSWFAAGEGARTIAKKLNIAKVPTPRAQRNRPHGWSASTVRAVLERPLYRGEYIYGRSAKAYGRELGKGAKRDKGQLATAEETWLRCDKPELRIINPALAERVDARRLDRKTRYTASLVKGGRAPEKAHGKYLLSGGLLICPTCGAHFEARKYPWRGNPGDVYMCSTRRRKPGVCSNTLALPIAETDDGILSVIEGEVLGTRVINELLSLVDTSAAQVHDDLTADETRLQREISNLMDLVAAGTPAATVAPKIREREVQLARIQSQLRLPRPDTADLEKLRAALEQRTEQWKADLRAEPKIARLLLRRLIGPMVLHEEPRPEWCRWEGKPKPTGLLDGIWSNWLASPTGFEPVF